MRSYDKKPLSGYKLNSLSVVTSKIDSIESFATYLGPKETDLFNKIFLKTSRIAFIVDQLNEESLNCLKSLPVIQIDSKDITQQILLTQGIYIDESNIEDSKLSLYLPLAITNLDLYDLITRIKRVISNV